MAGRVFVKVTKIRGETVVAVCDEELLGKRFVDEKRGLRLEVNERFYRGNIMDLKDCLRLLREASIANLVGSRIVEEALNAGLIHARAIIRIGGVPHAQIVRM
ncbi:DUF424 domain-containing protein [Candidatus Bathyarchaeota archaeon]|nr:MAG: DUF424 domain-containing protein [Candidatus Bathyarchaeota archaeon]